MILLQKTPSAHDKTEIGFVIEPGATWMEMYDDFRRFLYALGYEFSQQDVADYHFMPDADVEDVEDEDDEQDA